MKHERTKQELMAIAVEAGVDVRTVAKALRDGIDSVRGDARIRLQRVLDRDKPVRQSRSSVGRPRS